MTFSLHPWVTRATPLLFFALLSSAPALGAQSAVAEPVQKWVGAFDLVHTDGSVDPGTACLALIQQGTNITGSAGEAPDHLSPISAGHLQGQDLTFVVALDRQRTITFTLTKEGNRLLGTASGLPVEPGSKVEIQLMRADDAWHTPGPVTHAPDRLFQTVAVLDKRLFDAYNTCDLTTLGEIVTEDLEFYHDKTGLAVGRTVFLQSIKNNICGKVHRTLTPGSLEVHRLANYGAVEIGSHTFSHPGIDAEKGEAKFITIWRLRDGRWQVTRVISYDHGPTKPQP